MTLEINTLPVISTVHLDRATNDLLIEDPDRWGAGAYLIDCGFFLYLDDLEAAGEVPQCLIDIRDWRQRLEGEGHLDNSRWVRLDCDADPAPGLPVYDW